jgi:hypothetical protein
MIIKPEEWISKPDHDGNGQLNAWMEDGEVNFPIPIETHNVFPEDVRMNEAQDFELILECAGKPEIYAEEDAYNNAARHSMAPESVIPAGVLSASGDADSEQSAYIILSGKVVEIYEDSAQLGFDESDILYTLSCLGNEYDAVLHSEFSDDVQMKEGNIVSCVYRVQGWPKLDDNTSFPAS